MDVQGLLIIVKARLGISTEVRDEYLKAIINGILQELTEVQGIKLREDSLYQQMFVADFAVWRYQSRDEAGGMPRHLQARLHNLILSDGGGTDDV